MSGPTWRLVSGKGDLEERDPTPEEQAQANGAALPRQRPRYSGVYAPHWPHGLQEKVVQQVPCDDVRGAHLDLVNMGGDMFVTVYEPADEEHPEEGGSTAGIRIRNWAGGGRHLRTHQALLWLAEAIRRDNEDGGQFAPLEAPGMPWRPDGW